MAFLTSRPPGEGARELEWHDVDSSRIVAEAYDPEAEIIYVRFTDGTEYCYEACPPHVLGAVHRAGAVQGTYINDVLNYKPRHKHTS